MKNSKKCFSGRLLRQKLVAPNLALRKNFIKFQNLDTSPKVKKILEARVLKKD